MNKEQFKLKLLENNLSKVVSETWNLNELSLKESLLNNNIDDFLRFPVIIKTMFVGNADYINKEYEYIVNNGKFNTKWNNAIKENALGNPIPYIYNINTSGNNIHNCYSLCRFEENINLKINNFEYIFEVGGGYGCMAKVCYQAGFTGKYILYDLNIFLLLQEYYLSNLGYTNIEYLKNLDLLNIPNKKKTLFISTWSLSEMPIIIRDKIFDNLNEIQAFLICYQSMFDDIDNNKYFEKKIKNLSGYKWHNEIIKTMDGNHKMITGYDYHV